MDTQLLLSAPKISGEIRKNSQYNRMTIGETAPILLIGHSDALEQERPYRVSSMRDAINWLQADSSAPLLRGLLEAYNSGCRDIWLYSAAPMSEYYADVSVRNDVQVDLGNKTFYERYHERLATAYDILKEYDIFQVVVPLEASICDTSDIDFATPLAQLCEDIRASSGHSTLGVIGTRSAQYNQALIDNTLDDSVFDTIGGKGKYIMAVWGEGIIANAQMSRTYSGSMSTFAGALLCTVPLSRSIYGLVLSNVISLSGNDLSTAQKDQLTKGKINPVVQTQRGKRGQTFRTMFISDNTMAPDNSDFWSMNQMRTLSVCINTIKSYGEAYIGTNAYQNFKQIVRDFFRGLVVGDYIKDYTLDIRADNSIGRVYVDVGITPIFGIRNIYFTVETGPGS